MCCFSFLFYSLLSSKNPAVSFSGGVRSQHILHFELRYCACCKQFCAVPCKRDSACNDVLELLAWLLGDSGSGREAGSTGSEERRRHHQRIDVCATTTLPSDTQSDLRRKVDDYHLSDANRLQRTRRRAHRRATAATALWRHFRFRRRLLETPGAIGGVRGGSDFSVPISTVTLHSRSHITRQLYSSSHLFPFPATNIIIQAVTGVNF